MDLTEIILKARSMGCSDVHITAGEPIFFRLVGHLEKAPYRFPTSQEVEQMLLSALDGKLHQHFEEGNDLDFAIATPDGNRQRVNIFRQQGKMAATIRLVDTALRSIEELGLPPLLTKWSELPRGLVLVTGPTSSGKSTTLAAMVDHINNTRAQHIITIEDPVEYLHISKHSLIHQREVGLDTKDFASSLRSALREDPDVILVGEMRDYETISAALTAAETGHLVMSTLHTTSAPMTIDRIVDACPVGAQNQIRTQLGSILCGIVTQSLLPTKNGDSRCVATEVLVGTDAVLNMIREDKCHQLTSIMQSGGLDGMHTLDCDLASKVRSGLISKQTAYTYASDRREIDQLLS